MSEIDLLVAMAKDLTNFGLSLERMLNFVGQIVFILKPKKEPLYMSLISVKTILLPI